MTFVFKKKIKIQPNILYLLFICFFFLIVFFIRYVKNENVDDIQNADKIVNGSSDSYINGGPSEEGGFSYNDDGTVSLGFGLTGHGFFDSLTNKLLDTGTVIKPINGMIKGQVSFQQNLLGEQNYLLIIMIDYIQQKFTVGNNEYFSYPFTLIGDDETRIEIEVQNIISNSREFEYIIIREPNVKNLSIDNKDEWNKMHITKNIYTWRLPLSNITNNLHQLEYDNSYEAMTSESYEVFALTRTHEDVTVLPTCNGLDEIELALGNVKAVTVDYALVTLIDWKQPTLENNILPTFVSIPAETNVFFNITLPDVDYPTPFQVIAFPSPFSDEIKFTVPISTFRTIIVPN